MDKAARQSEGVWRGHVAAWRASGVSRGEYCAEHGLSRRTFGWWAWHLARGEAEAREPRFLAVETISIAEASGDGPGEGRPPRVAAEPTASRSLMEIALPDGVAVRVGADVDTEALCRVLRALGR